MQVATEDKRGRKVTQSPWRKLRDVAP